MRGLRVAWKASGIMSQLFTPTRLAGILSLMGRKSSEKRENLQSETAQIRVERDTARRNSKGQLMELPAHLKKHLFSSDYQPHTEKRILRHREITTMFRAKTLLAANKVLEVMLMPNARPQDVLHAAEIVLDRSLGKATTPLAIALQAFEQSLDSADNPEANQVDALVASLTEEKKFEITAKMVAAIREIRGAIPVEFKEIKDAVGQ